MKILPTKTDPPTTPIVRRHRPRAGAYSAYRPCLRWEFGFSCALCLLHEADFVAHGIEGTGLTGVEHHVPRSHDSNRTDEYGNCLYACRFCNGARSDAPNVDAKGRELLNPCETAWAERFRWLEFSLVPRDPDAEYTAETYDLDDPRKREMRRARAASIALGLRILSEGPDRIRRLLQVIERVSSRDRSTILEAAEELQSQIVTARRELARFRMVPLDADDDCRCAPDIVREPPLFLTAQAIEISAL